MPFIERVAARVLVISPQDRVLLLRLEPDFRDAFWVTPGGGVDEGETLEAAAARELREEAGRADLPIGEIAWSRDVKFTWAEWSVLQHEHTFVVRSPEEFVARVAHPDGEPITGSGWFGIDDLSALDETVYPEDLADRLRRLFGG
jgi:8-oxo-dGTP pyrophosphatase MutT (NUDIX family)